MLRTVSPIIEVCLTRAQEARESAAAAADAEDRDFWREMERRWMHLAHTHELATRMDDFLRDQKIKRLH